MSDAIIYNLGGTDKTLILNTRRQLTQPFVAPNWLDLRLTVAYSITKAADDNDPTTLAETIGAGEDKNQVFMGFRTRQSIFRFLGLSTQLSTPDSATCDLVAGADFYNFWHDTQHGKLIYASDGTTKQNNSATVVSPRIQNDLSGTYAGYATLLLLRMVRSGPTDTSIMLSAHLDSTALDNGVPFETDTTVGNLRSITAAADFTDMFASNFDMGVAPNALYFFWPFTLSRLRIHDYVLEQYD